MVPMARKDAPTTTGAQSHGWMRVAVMSQQVLTFLTLDQPLAQLQSDEGGPVQDDVRDALPCVRGKIF